MIDAIELVANDDLIPPHIDVATSNAIDYAREAIRARIEEAVTETHEDLTLEHAELIKDVREYLVETISLSEKLLGRLPKEKE